MLNSFVDPLIQDLFPHGRLFETAFSIQGEVFRNVKNRRTVRFEFNGRHYFIKQHRGPGWREIFKCLSQGKRPVLGAANEFLAIRKLESLGISTMVCRAFAERGKNPARRESFIITDEMTGKITLEDFCRNWKTEPPDPALKHALIARLAEICAKMHFAGLNHRDCYLCHFLLDRDDCSPDRVRLSVMDLHRAEIRKVIPRRMRVKDLAGIFFSSMDAGLSKYDALRFIAKYSSFGPLDSRLWRDVFSTAVRLYRKEWKRDPVL